MLRVSAKTGQFVLSDNVKLSALLSAQRTHGTSPLYTVVNGGKGGGPITSRSISMRVEIEGELTHRFLILYHHHLLRRPLPGPVKSASTPPPPSIRPLSRVKMSPDKSTMALGGSRPSPLDGDRPRSRSSAHSESRSPHRRTRSLPPHAFDRDRSRTGTESHEEELSYGTNEDEDDDYNMEAELDLDNDTIRAAQLPTHAPVSTPVPSVGADSWDGQELDPSVVHNAVVEYSQALHLSPRDSWNTVTRMATEALHDITMLFRHARAELIAAGETDETMRQVEETYRPIANALDALNMELADTFVRGLSLDPRHYSSVLSEYGLVDRPPRPLFRPADAPLRRPPRLPAHQRQLALAPPPAPRRSHRTFANSAEMSRCSRATPSSRRGTSPTCHPPRNRVPSPPRPGRSPGPRTLGRRTTRARARPGPATSHLRRFRPPRSPCVNAEERTRPRPVKTGPRTRYRTRPTPQTQKR
ncbi:hypothetical protein C8Q80DRAFT_782395 [Daedaleopsis nitida]|nr:hypothetical protein C8Q80DRAFT_782395 [Daedaleopsis nitida]